MHTTLGSVLVATDFSSAGRVALERAASLPLSPGALFHLLHVLPTERDPEVAARMDTDATRLLEGARGIASHLLEDAGNNDVDVVMSTKHGQPFVEIVRSARSGRAELIVVGRHGERSFRDLLVGSTAERVVRKGDVSVLVVATAPEGPYQKPLVAVDMSDSSRLALELTLRVSDPAAERIDVVHVVSLPSPVYAPEAALLPDLERRRVEEEQSAREKLAEFLGKVGGDEARWNVVVGTGDPRQVIVGEARTRRADLVAVGTKGRAGIAHVLVGSVAEGVIRSASSDVLVARLSRAEFRLP